MRSVRIDDDIWVAFTNICKAHNSNAATEIRRFIEKVVLTGYPKDDESITRFNLKDMVQSEIKEQVPLDVSQIQEMIQSEVKKSLAIANTQTEAVASELSKSALIARLGKSGLPSYDIKFMAALSEGPEYFAKWSYERGGVAWCQVKRGKNLYYQPIPDYDPTK